MIPQRIEIKGFQSHAHTILDLSNIDYAMVVGNNGAGKSTIFGAMLFGLFGDAYTRDTGANMSEFFRHGAAELSVDFQFALGDQRLSLIHI